VRILFMKCFLTAAFAAQNCTKALAIVIKHVVETQVPYGTVRKPRRTGVYP